MFKKGDIVLYNNEKYKVDNVRVNNNGQEILKIHSIRGKVNSIMYNIPIYMVTKINSEENII